MAAETLGAPEELMDLSKLQSDDVYSMLNEIDEQNDSYLPALKKQDSSRLPLYVNYLYLLQTSWYKYMHSTHEYCILL